MALLAETFCFPDSNEFSHREQNNRENKLHHGRPSLCHDQRRLHDPEIQFNGIDEMDSPAGVSAVDYLVVGGGGEGGNSRIPCTWVL